MNKVRQEPDSIELKQEMGGDSIVFEIKKGESWSQQMKAGPFIFNILPQIVIWMEDESGDFITTLYITGADGKGFRHAVRMERHPCFRIWRPGESPRPRISEES